MGKVEILALLLIAFVFGTLANPAASKRGKNGDGPAEAKQPEAELTHLTVDINGNKALLICGDPAGAQVENRRKTNGKQGGGVSPIEGSYYSDSACSALANVEDLVVKLKAPASSSSSDPDPCLNEEEQATEVKIEGRFKGKQVSYKGSFRNKCQLKAVAPEILDIRTMTGMQGRTFYHATRYGR